MDGIVTYICPVPIKYDQEPIILFSFLNLKDVFSLKYKTSLFVMKGR